MGKWHTTAVIRQTGIGMPEAKNRLLKVFLSCAHEDKASAFVTSWPHH
jgi:hypothetical protein